MFTGIKTTKRNKELVTQLTKQLNLGTENVIARLAFVQSLINGRKLDLYEIGDSQGKEYTSKVLFGDYADIYLAMLCAHYQLYKTDKDLIKYIKMHVDDGLQIIANELKKCEDMNGTEYLINKVGKGFIK